MKLIVLGSGTCVPSLRRGAPAYYLEAEGRQMLVDCGSGTLLQLERIGRSYRDIDAVCITHTHPDHVADLFPFIQALFATPLFTREKELFIIGPEGIEGFYKKCIESIVGKPKTFSIQLIEMQEKMDYLPFHIFTARTLHSENSIAFRFEYKDKSVVITGDAGYNQEIVDLSTNVDLLIADCSFPESMKGQGHMTPRECGLVAQKAGVKRLLLSHLHALPVPDEDKVKECRQAYDGAVSLAEDFFEFHF